MNSFPSRIHELPPDQPSGRDLTHLIVFDIRHSLYPIGILPTFQGLVADECLDVNPTVDQNGELHDL